MKLFSLTLPLEVSSTALHHIPPVPGVTSNSLQQDSHGFLVILVIGDPGWDEIPLWDGTFSLKEQRRVFRIHDINGLYTAELLPGGAGKKLMSGSEAARETLDCYCWCQSFMAIGLEAKPFTSLSLFPWSVKWKGT
jgi:hypothetical protein